MRSVMLEINEYDDDDDEHSTVATNGNNVEATFDIVERIVQLVAFDNVAWTSLLVWTGFTVVCTD